ncbi:histidine phosphatase family protein [Gordonibacter sp. 28C]|uniref:SixA phosphatase family protein n=1 Tax=Gordonibacter sp. 28C TaxID=2078569 RepID=UPI0013144725|nr:histidine phosphatase family protein [Gordonibacter sp. 28C]
MAKVLVLVRHGKAQKRSADVPDELRALTEAGRKALAAHLPQALALLDVADGPDVAVLASPAVRTRQTADEVAKALGAGAPVDCESLFAQDAESFMQDVANASADIVVAVGHNPFAEELTERLCGARIGFSTGAMAAIELSEDTDDGTARLLWFVQGPRPRPSLKATALR